MAVFIDDFPAANTLWLSFFHITAAARLTRSIAKSHCYSAEFGINRTIRVQNFMKIALKQCDF